MWFSVQVQQAVRRCRGTMTPLALHGNSLELPLFNATGAVRNVVALSARKVHMFSIKREPGLLVTKPDVRPACGDMASNTCRHPAVKATLMWIFVTIQTPRSSRPRELLDPCSVHSVARMALDTWYSLVPSIECHSGRVVHCRSVCCGDEASLLVAIGTIARVGPSRELPRMGIRMATRASFVAGKIHRFGSRSTWLPVTVHTFHSKMFSPQSEVRRPVAEILHRSFTPAGLHVTTFAPRLRLACRELTIVRVSVAVRALLEFRKPERTTAGFCTAT